jgi:predicted ester cyclase
MPSSEQNIMKVSLLLDEAFSKGDYAVIDELVAPEFVEHQNGVQGTGPEAVRRIVKGLRKSFPDLTLTIEDIVATSDKAWVRSRAQGTDTGGVAGRPPTGVKIEIDVVDVIRFDDGKMVEHWGVADRLGMLQQVGVVARPGEEPRAA